MLSKDLHLNLAPNWCIPLIYGFLLVLILCCFDRSFYYMGRKKKLLERKACSVALWTVLMKPAESWTAQRPLPKHGWLSGGSFPDLLT